jgi:hypothetical protein
MLYFLENGYILGVFMRKIIFCSICFVSLFLINCDNEESSWVSTNINFLNESSYNLHVSIKTVPPHLDFSREFNLKKGETFETWLEYARRNDSDKPRNPNEEMIKIRFFNSDTKGLIKEMPNENNLFKFIQSDNDLDYFQFTITDDLLQS